MRPGAILLIDPKFKHNVGGVVRAASCFGVSDLRWSGDRVIAERDRRGIAAGAAGTANGKGDRLPREERLRVFNRHVDWARLTVSPEDWLNRMAWDSAFTPVCVELDETAEALPHFTHPERPLYVFGPEDGSVPKSVRAKCHRFVTIPASTCLNLAAAVNVVLYDRNTKLGIDNLSDALDRQEVDA